MKVEIQNYKNSIHEIGLPREQEAILWDFYVTKSIAESASQKRTVTDYGLKALPWKEMLQVAGLDSNNVKILLANSINKTLERYDLSITEGKGDNKSNKPIEIGVPKIVCLTPYSIADEELPKGRVGEAESVLTHIRNSFAHGLTYFLPNNMVLLEDKDQRGTITARIILRLQTLLDWVALIDKDERYYVLHKIGETKDGTTDS